MYIRPPPESASIVISAVKLAHFLCFATCWGAALWVTFIGGIIIFKNLPRHMFGNLQSKMFPAYFMVVSVSAATSVAAFAYLHPWRMASSVEKYQLGFLLSALGFNLSNLLVFISMTILRHKVERELSIGEEVGWSKNMEVVKANPKLKAMKKKFGTIHGLSSLANILSFGSLAMHSWYLAGKLYWQALLSCLQVLEIILSSLKPHKDCLNGWFPALYFLYVVC